MPVYSVFKTETGEIILGGLIGAPVADCVSGLVAGLAKQTGWAKFGVKLGIKLLWSIGWLAAAEWGTDNEDAQNVLIGLAAGPIFTIPDDIVQAQTGKTIGQYSYDWGLAQVAKSAARSAAGGRPVVVHTPSLPGTPTVQTVQIRGGRG